MQRTPVVTFWQHGWIIFKTALRATHTTLKSKKKHRSSSESAGPISSDKNLDVSVAVYTACSVNSVTSIALHGPPQWCVSAAEAGYHNRNPIQTFYSRQEICCIPSNNTHCLSIHILLCNPPQKRSARVRGRHTLENKGDNGWRYTCTSLSAFYLSQTHPWGCTINPTILVNMSGTGLCKDPTFLKMMRCLMRGCHGNGHVKTSTFLPSLDPNNKLV